MRVGTLVKIKSSATFGDTDKIGIVKSIASPNPIVKVVWANGYVGAYHIGFLEVLCK